LASAVLRRAILSGGAAMTARINHVSISAVDLRESVDFYVELLGAEPIATPNFGMPIQWLALGQTQLHVFERDVAVPSHHHLGITVDDLEPAYRIAEARGALDDDAFGSHLVELPGDVVQLYLRDPAGNLVELDSPGAGRLPEDLRGRMRRLRDVRPQDDEQLSARLFVDA
jgi:catechol 2,3-dioxygenase-like lactoylglutathione lyase family enzyme